MVLALKEFIKKRKEVNVFEICMHFSIEETALLPMLASLEKKNIIRKADTTCSTCNSSCSACLEWGKGVLYQYVEKP